MVTLTDVEHASDDAVMAWPASTLVPTRIHATSRAWREPTTFELDAVVPPRIAGLPVLLPADVSAAVVEAERALARLDADLSGTPATVIEATTFALLRSESVSSSRIEGIEITNRRLAEALHDAGSAKYLAREVVGNIEAMHAAVDYGATAEPFRPEDLRDLHRRLMTRVPGMTEGEWRTEQNWIGPADLAEGAVFVPPPPEFIGALIDDLCEFVNSSPAPAVVRAAIAHAQFEAIHPFVDGNGRVGRCLVSVTLRKAGGTNTIPPVSSVLLMDTQRYFDELQQFQLHANPAPWIVGFANATVEACRRARALMTDIDALKRSWADRVGGVRAGTQIERLLDELPTLTLASADQVAQRLDVDPNVARRLLGQLEDAGIVKQVTSGRRNRVWRVDEMLRLLDDHSLGRALA